MQPPETEPAMTPSSRSASHAPGGRGAEPQVRGNGHQRETLAQRGPAPGRVEYLQVHDYPSLRP